jgi:aminopeptidase N
LETAFIFAKIFKNMKRILLFLGIAAFPLCMMAQQKEETTYTSWKNIYRESYPKTNEVVHTKLQVSFDYDKSYMYGKEWLTLRPHFYATDSVLLDAKGMEIKELALISGTTKKPLKYSYDGKQLSIHLDKLYAGGEKYTLYFDYVSKPNELKVQGSAAITDAKGLYFINPKGEDKTKPTEIWTQGETEANSAWMITIDKPDQKSTEEIYMTVPAKYVTLSNGLKISEKKNADGTRTDYWKMDLPHAPYLFFMGVGDYAITKDSYKGKEVSYYTELDQQQYARRIFGHTPEMIKFYSDKLGIDFPWPKYAQIVGRDYVSGAMENTTSTLHGSAAYQSNRELVDGNSWEDVIAHELFHQWFGDLVTTESWSNITVNESMADYSETLWNEYKYGKDAGDKHIEENRQTYLEDPTNFTKDLVRFYYKDKEDIFDNVSYPKGGAILHMLRNYVGDDAFFKSLNLYLTTNKFKTGEAHQLRLAFEEITGQDLNWFWNEWYYGSGHPRLDISYSYNIPGLPGLAEVIVKQTQTTGKIFTLPIAIDVYTNGKRDRYNVILKNAADSFYFKASETPELINVDADKILLAEKDDHKTEANYIAQWKYARNYLDRKEALEFFAKKNMPEIAKGLYDKYAPLRGYTIQQIDATPYRKDVVAVEQIATMAQKEKDKKTKAAAIDFLVKNGDKKYLPIYEAAANDSSYTVAGAALYGLATLDPSNAYTLAKQYSSDAKGTLGEVVSAVLLVNGNEGDFDIIASSYRNSPSGSEKVAASGSFSSYLSKISDNTKVKQGIDYILEYRKSIPPQLKDQIEPLFKAGFDEISKAKGKEIEAYINAGLKQ